MPADVPRFSPHGRFVYFRGLEGGADDIWEVSLESGLARPVTDLRGKRGFMEYLFATDGRYIYVPWREDLGDIWVMDVVSDEGY